MAVAGAGARTAAAMLAPPALGLVLTVAPVPVRQLVGTLKLLVPVVEKPELFWTVSVCGPAWSPVEGICTSRDVLEPLTIVRGVVPSGPASRTDVPAEEGGVPKLLPAMVNTVPHAADPGALMLLGAPGVGVGVVVLVGVWVTVGTGVVVDVGVEPTCTSDGKPEVMHGRSPSA